MDLSNYVTDSELEALQEELANFKTSTNSTLSAKLGKNEAEGIYAKKTDISDFITSNVANSTFATKDSVEELGTTVNTLSTTVGNKADQGTVNGLTSTVNNLSSTVGSVSSTVEDLVNSVDDLTTTIDTKADKDTVNSLSVTVGNKADKSALSDYAKTSDLSNYVPITRTINGKGLSNNITLKAIDVDAPSTEVFNNLSGSVSSLSTTVGDIAEEIKGLVSDAELSEALALKQNVLVSGTHIKTINGNTLLGSGDLKIDAVSTDALNSAVTSINATIDDLRTDIVENTKDITNLNGAESLTGSVKNVAKSYADAAKSSSKTYVDGKLESVNLSIETINSSITSINTNLDNKAN